MLGKLFKKETPNVYLGELEVAPVSTLQRYDNWGLFKSEDLEEGLRNSLKELIDLPPIKSLTTPMDTDLVLDMTVPKHQGGIFTSIAIGDFGSPILWKPKVVLEARLYRRTTGKTLYTFISTKKVSWWHYTNRAFRLTSLLSLKPMFGVKDLEILLCQAGIEVLEKVNKKINR